MEKRRYIPNKIIILGGNHHNGLGIIRSLGEVGCRIFFISLGVEKNFVVKSRYLEKYWTVFNEEELLDVILNYFGNDKIKPIIIPSDDRSAAIIDKNINILNVSFLFPNMDNQKNAILNQMNKNSMTLLAAKHGFKTPKSFILKLTEINKVETYLERNHIKYPCIIKPLQSVDGQKSDISINESRNELIINLKKLKEEYSEVFIQDYIQKEKEIGVQGIAIKNGKELTIPGMVNKIRDSVVAPGSTTYAFISKVPNNYNLKKIDLSLRSLIKELKFEGIFDLELMYSQGQLYFIELNFRNGAYGYAYTRAGINMPLLWCLGTIGKIDSINESKQIKKEITLMSEIADFKNVIVKNTNIFKWLIQFLKTDVYLLFNRRDIKPFIYKILYK